MKYETRYMAITFSTKGKIDTLIDKSDGRDYLLKSKESRFGILCSDEKEEFAALRSVKNLIIAAFPERDLEITFEVKSEDEYLVFKVLEMTKCNFDCVELMKLSLSIVEKQAEYLNGCHNQKFLIALISLTPEVNSFFSERSPEISTFGVRCYPKFGLMGARFALIGCPPDKFLDIADRIQERYALPRCVKALRSDSVNKSYLFMGGEVNENDSDEVIGYARQGRFGTVMLGAWNWYSTWDWVSKGYSRIHRKYFPEGIVSLNRFTDRLHKAGIEVGLHNAAPCIRFRDPYVTPVPSPYLYARGAHVLSDDVDENKNIIPVISANPESLTRAIESAMGATDTEAETKSADNIIRIDNELIKFSRVSAGNNCALLECTRGSCDTYPAPHKRGAIVYHLMQIFENLFTPACGTPLWDEIAQRLADVANSCGIDFVYCDYAERSQGWLPPKIEGFKDIHDPESGNWYYTAKFLKNVYDRIENRDVLFQSSLWLAGGGYSWHLSPRTCFMNGGKDIKKAVDERLPVVSAEAVDNFKKLEIGWCRILDPSWYSVDEIEYICKKAIGHNAVVSLLAGSLDVLKKKSDTKEIFDTIAKYRKMQEENAFSDEEKETFGRCDFRKDEVQNISIKN